MRIVRTAREPLYFQLRDLLLHQITYELQEGDRLPSEAELCSKYGISRTVVRQALDELDEVGVVYTVKGKGTFVTRRKVEASYTQDASGFSDTMTRLGHRVTSAVLSSRVVGANPLVARALRLAVGELVVEIERCRSVDGEVNCVGRGDYVAHLVPGLENVNLDGEISLYSVLKERYGLLPFSGRRTVEAGAMSRLDGELLGVEPGYPALIIEGVTTAATGELFEHFRTVYRGDRFKLDLVAESPRPEPGEAS